MTCFYLPLASLANAQSESPSSKPELSPGTFVYGAQDIDNKMFIPGNTGIDPKMLIPGNPDIDPDMLINSFP